MLSRHDVRIGRILCAVTFSPSSGRVIDWAATLADIYGAEVRLFHVLTPPAAYEMSAAGDASEGIMNKLIALTRHLPGRTRISAGVTYGGVADELLQHARLIQADLVVMGMHSRDGRVTPLIASIANEASCPVFAVDARSAPRPAAFAGAARCGPELVCPVNFRPASLAGADYAVGLGRATRARITLVHVLPERWDGPQREDANADDLRRASEHQFRHLLQAVVPGPSGPGRHVTDVVKSGEPAAEIVRLARTIPADFIVMGIDAVHDGSAPLGATAGCIVQFANCSVLLVPQRLLAAPVSRRSTLETDPGAAHSMPNWVGRIRQFRLEAG
jgi:nucleotide-binding universal stress UspA family protein